MPQNIIEQVRSRVQEARARAQAQTRDVRERIGLGKGIMGGNPSSILGIRERVQERTTRLMEVRPLDRVGKLARAPLLRAQGGSSHKGEVAGEDAVVQRAKKGVIAQ